MRLFELAYGCRLYADLTTYDASLEKLRSLAEQVDPFDEEHRSVLFDWLNDWGCRQFAKEHHATTASTSLMTWSDHWLKRLPAFDEQLSEMLDVELSECVAAYDALKECPASLKSRPGGRTSTVRFGPTGAAKTLFALRPNLVAPWDEPIRAAKGWGPDAASFQSYLREVAKQLRDLSAAAGVQVRDLPALVGRPKSSPPKLIDEYNWVTFTRRCPPPHADEVARWAAWAARGEDSNHREIG